MGRKEETLTEVILKIYEDERLGRENKHNKPNNPPANPQRESNPPANPQRERSHEAG